MQQVSSSKTSWLRSPRTTPGSRIKATRFERCRETFTGVYFVALFSIYLLYTGEAGYDTIDSAKMNAFWFVNACYVGGVVVSYLVQHGLKVSPLTLPALHTTDMFAISFCLFAWASALNSKNWPGTLFGLNNNEGVLVITMYVLVFLLVSHHGHIEGSYYGAMALNLVIFWCLCMPQFAGYNVMGLYKGDKSFLDYAGENPYRMFCGTIGNTNLVALFLVLVTLLLVFAISRLKSRFRFILVPAALMCLCIFRHIWVMLGFVGLVLGSLLSFPVVAPKGKRLKVTGVVAGVLLLSAIILYFTDAGTGLFHEIHQVLHGQLDGDFGSGRIYIWECLLQELDGHWLFGHGPDTIIVSGVEPFIVDNPVLGVTYVNIITDAHNIYLQTLYCLGAPALILFMLVVGDVMISWIRLAPKSDHIAVLGTGLLGYCIAAFFCISHPSVNLYFWCLLGFLEAEVRSVKK